MSRVEKLSVSTLGFLNFGSPQLIVGQAEIVHCSSLERVRQLFLLIGDLGRECHTELPTVRRFLRSPCSKGSGP